MKHFCCTLVFLHLPSILGRHLVNDAADLDEKISDDVLHTVARGLRSGDGVDMRMFDNLRLSSKRNGTSTVGERISSTADTWSQVREESAPAGVATSIEASLAVKESANTDQDQDDEDYVETVLGTDYMDLDSPGHEQGGNWQSTPSRDGFLSTAVVPQYPGTKETQRHAVPMYSDPHASLSAWQPMSSLAQEVHVTSDGEVEFGEDFGDSGDVEHELQEDYL